MGKTTWTFEMESQLALFYEKHTPMKEMCEWLMASRWKLILTAIPAWWIIH